MTRVGSVRTVPNESMASTMSSMVWDQCRSRIVLSAHIHGLVDLSTFDHLPGDLNVVVVKVLLNLILVNRVDDCCQLTPGMTTH